MPGRASRSTLHFKKVAPSWIGRYAAIPSFRTRLRIVADVAGRLTAERTDARILDVGSGPGVLAAAVSASASVVVCVDTSWEMLREGALRQAEIDDLLDAIPLSHRSESIVRVAGSTRALAGSVGRPFDIVLAIAVLEYQSDPVAFLTDLAEIVRPGGLMLLTIPDHRSLVRRVERPIDALASGVGRILRADRLRDRSYSSTRPFGSGAPWLSALAATGVACREIVPLPLGDRGLRRMLRPNLLVVAEVRR